MAKATDGRRCAQGAFRSPTSLTLERPRPFILSPTDLTFLWEECRRCFHRKVVLGQRRPSTPFPKVFGTIDRAMKNFYLGERAELLAPGAPAGVLGAPDRWVKSASIALPGRAGEIVIRGRLDALVACDDGTAGVVDFKTAPPSDTHVPFYGRQLHAYTWALEEPASGRPIEVSCLGLLCFSPDSFEAGASRAALLGEVEWIEVARDDKAFTDLLGEVASVLEADGAPAPGPDCPWCGADPGAC